MAKRHIIEYCGQVNKYYNGFVSEIKELEKLCTEHTVSPDTIESMKIIFEPLKQLWTNSNYYLYLLKLGKTAVMNWVNECKNELDESEKDFVDIKNSNNISEQIVANLEIIYKTSLQKYRSAMWLSYLINMPNRRKKEIWYKSQNQIDTYNTFTYNYIDFIGNKAIKEIKTLNESISQARN